MFKDKEICDIEENKATIDANSIEKVYHVLAGRLLRLCFKLVGDADEAENIIHDVFESVWKRRKSINITTSLEAYLTQAVKLQALKFFRDKADHEAVDNLLLNSISVSETTTEQQVLYNDLSEKLNILVDQMPNQCRKVYMLSHEHGLSNKEIASQLLISESAVEQHKAKAKASLRNGLAEYR